MRERKDSHGEIHPNEEMVLPSPIVAYDICLSEWKVFGTQEAGSLHHTACT